MSKIMVSHDLRHVAIIRLLRDAEDWLLSSDYEQCGAHAAEARDMACVGRILASDLFKVVNEHNPTAARVWAEFTNRYGVLETTACDMLADCEAYWQRKD